MVNGNLKLNVSTADTDRPIFSCPETPKQFPETQNSLRVNKTTSRNKFDSGKSYPQAQYTKRLTIFAIKAKS